jgi:putative oxidoreductase
LSIAFTAKCHFLPCRAIRSLHYQIITQNKNKFMKLTALTGRILFSLIFFFSGLSLFASATAGYAASQGVPLASILVPIAGILSVLGAISIMLGYKTRIGAAMIIVFLVPVTLVFHHFWTITDAQARQAGMIDFMKNISILGGAIIMLVHGAGAYSLDSRAKAVTEDLQPQYANKA